MANKPDSDLTQQIKQNYQSIILGVLVILVGIFVLSRASNTGKTTKPEEKKAEEKAALVATPGQTYTVQKGDTLWSIAQKTYQSGYAWTEISKTNRLKNANNIEAGQKLAIPKVDQQKYVAMLTPKTMPRKVVTRKIVPTTKPMAKSIQTSQVTIKGSTYKVVKGDNLWSISVRAYGDGYAWTKVWKANKKLIKNPNLIYPGETLQLPR